MLRRLRLAWYYNSHLRSWLDYSTGTDSMVETGSPHTTRVMFVPDGNGRLAGRSVADEGCGR